MENGKWKMGRGLAHWVGVAAVLSAVFSPRQMRAEEKVDEVLKKAAQYLISQQEPTGGIHNKQRNETAMTSLAVLALAACGHQPGDPTPEGLAMRKSLGLTWTQTLMAANAPMLTKAALVDGKVESGVLPSGQVVGVIDDLPTCKELIDRIIAEADKVLENLEGTSA